MSKRRAQAESTIAALYGDTDLGNQLLATLVAEMGMAALTDEAVVMLARMHIRAEERLTLEAERRHSRAF
jgi:hypothetical protein